jgi:7-keto-8-aminopelargonate synthetase-like enzyme
MVMAQVEKTNTWYNRFRNNEKAIGIGNEFWEATARNGLSGIVANLVGGGYLETGDGHRFLNLSCCSYLDLDSHPKIIEGAIRSLQKYGVLDHCISRIRIQLPALLELEESLTSLFRAKVVTAISASAATAGVLPLVASGHLCGNHKPVMVFDKNAHFSMNLYKSVCGDETEVLTSPHNDMNYLEDACKKYDHVAYVCDGTYSMGGHAPVGDLLALQNKYGMFIYFDDSHSLSIMGEKGEGFIRSNIDEFNDKTIIVATLNKAFGTSGGVIMFGPKGKDVALLLERFGGPLAWSQPMNMAAIGASLAAAEIHDSPELKHRQERLQRHIALFDERVDSEQRGNGFPIKLVGASNDRVMSAGLKLYREGFYVSPVFFPIVPRNQAGLRVMVRAGVEESEILRLCAIIAEAALV